MSYRSALSSPEISSGNIGATFTASNPAQVVFAQSVVSTLTSLALPAGVWMVQTETTLELNGALTFGNGFLNLSGSFPQSSGNIGLWYVSEMVDTTSLATGFQESFSFCSPITLASPAVITFSFTTDSASGTGNLINSLITAVKIA